MKDITRIHIAKVPYDIEVAAKQELLEYTTELETYAGSDEVYQDLEIRITELLAERGVAKDSVIGLKDVEAVRSQLGEAKEVMPDEDRDELAVVTNDSGKRMYRDMDRAILGGVLSGMSRYFKINPLWARLAFIVLIFISFGTALLLYAAFWLFMPAANTAAEKLQMKGENVTLESLRHVSDERVENKTPKIVLRVITALAGIATSAVAIGVMAMYGGLIREMTRGDAATGWFAQLQAEPFGSWNIAAFTLALSAGLVFILFMLLCSYALFRQIFKKHVWVTGIVLIVLGISLFTTAIGIAIYSSHVSREQLREQLTVKSVGIPDGFTSIDRLNVSGLPAGVPVRYEVSARPDIEIETPYDETVRMEVSDATGDLRYEQRMTSDSASRELLSEVRIKGPALESLNIQDTSFTYVSDDQQSLSVEADEASRVAIEEGRIATLTGTVSNQSTLDAESIAVDTVRVTMSSDAEVTLGTVQTLSVNSDETCGTEGRNELYAQAVNDGAIRYNDQRVQNETYENSCVYISRVGMGGE